MPSQAETIAGEVRTWLAALGTTTAVTIQALSVAPPRAPDRQTQAATKYAWVHPFRQEIDLVNRARARHRKHVIAIWLVWPGSGESAPDWSAALTWIDEVAEGAAANAWTNGGLQSIAIGEDGVLGDRERFYKTNVFETAILLTFAATS